MKLRDRQKPAQYNIKQEDIKLTFNITESSTPTTSTSSITDDFDVKQEEIKDHGVLMPQHGEFGKSDYRYYCDICNKKMASFKSVLEHRKSTHNIKQTTNRKIKNMDVEPDVHNLNSYCKSCEKSYKSMRAYRHHLRCVHYMILTPISRWKPLRSDTAPDPDDPNFCCAACDRTYTLRSNYLRHCRYAHGMKSGRWAYRKYPSSNIMDTYCQTCDKRLGSPTSYRKHLHIVHQVDQRPKPQKPKDVMPDVNDPDFYCRSCERKLANRNTFKAHLVVLHSLNPSPQKKSKIKPDVDDPNNYCRACQKTYRSQGRYQIHLRLVHQIALPSPRAGDTPKELPDPNNPRHYCNTAGLMLDPNASIDICNYKFYCGQCRHFYSSKQNFRKHTQKVHSIEAVSKCIYNKVAGLGLQAKLPLPSVLQDKRKADVSHCTGRIKQEALVKHEESQKNKLSGTGEARLATRSVLHQIYLDLKDSALTLGKFSDENQKRSVKLEELGH
ncbi:hypothetical protein MAM1_0014c01385 [Mucor ambiguus]|uniref:C2H2-type domain-containing protein n=1 Tax=Mucor ambiguus TaxID=91626 RepID=A0A0C9MJ68_9FUNG|nr:hypothetical protein MAM1_0014c01385 [Mucor ambiguus]